jgi:hypothetical protein
VLSGIIGERAARLYLEMCTSKARYLNPLEIIRTPNTCRLPETATDALQIGSLLEKISKENPNSAWVFAGRLSQVMGGDEVQQQLYALLQATCRIDSKKDFAKEAKEIQNKLSMTRAKR